MVGDFFGNPRGEGGGETGSTHTPPGVPHTYRVVKQARYALADQICTTIQIIGDERSNFVWSQLPEGPGDWSGGSGGSVGATKA